MKRILTNAWSSKISSIAGGYLGIPEIIDGCMAQDWARALKGLAILILGLVTNEKQVQPKI